MGFKRKWLFFVLPLVVLSVALGWAKPKANAPPLTKRDRVVRQRVLGAKEAYITHGEFFYVLSRQEKKDLASHLWLRDDSRCTIVTTGDEIVWSWGESGIYRDEMFMGTSASTDFLLLEDPNIAPHSATSRYLRQWLANHPKVRKQLHLK